MTDGRLVSFACLRLALVATCAPLIAEAHSVSQSALMLDFTGHGLRAELQVPLQRLNAVYGKAVDLKTLGKEQSPLGAYLLSRFHVRTAKRAEFQTRLTSLMSIEKIDDAFYIVAHIDCAAPRGAQTDRLELEDDVVLDSMPNQVALVSIRSDWRLSVFADDPQLVGVLHSNDRSLEIDRSQGSWARGFKSIFRLGIQHIAEGTDHLLFILALLLPAPLLTLRHRWAGPAPVRSSLGRILKVVTAFTVGHSLTLALSALGLLRVPSRPIEVLIAVSILISAVHALRPIFPGKEAGIAAFFGLIHGLAFAKTLAELGLGDWERVSGILAFNLGIETMQLIVVAAVMPSLLMLSHTPFYSPLRAAGASIAGIAALGWIAERLLNIETPVDAIVGGVAHQSLVICCVSTLVSASLWLFTLNRQSPNSTSSRALEAPVPIVF